MNSNMKIKIALVCALIVSAVYCDGQQLTQCLTTVTAILNDKKNPLQPIITGSSSQGFNNLGDMDRCLYQDNTNFISLYIDANLGNLIPTPYVLCLPDVCTADLIRENVPTFNLILNQQLAKYHIGDQFGITNVYDSTNDSPSVTAGAVIVMIIFGILILFSVAGSFIVYQYESKKERILKEQIQRQQQSSDGYENVSQNERNDDNELPQETALVKIGKAFGFVENFNKLFSFKSAGHIDFAIFNGTRFFLIVWIIIGQSYLIRYGSIKNVSDKTTIETSTGYSTIAATSQLAVELFFYISGFLLAAITLERFSNRMEVSIGDLLIFILHRLIRLWPTYFLAILFYWQIWQYSGDGPMWNQYTEIIGYCDSRAWANIFMIDNLANNGDTTGCFAWGFVIANEIQFFIVGVVLLYIYNMNSKVGLSLIFSFFVASQVASIVISSNNNYLADYYVFNNPNSYFNDFHIKPWVKMGTYFLGVMTGIFYRSFKTGNTTVLSLSENIQKSPALRYALYFVGLGLISSMVWCIIPVQQDPSNWSQGGHSTYLAFGKIGFAIGYFLLTLPLLFGQRNVLRGILGARFWVPLSRVTFCMYLVHQFVIQRSLFNQRSLRYFDNQLAFYFAISDTIFTLLFGAAFCVIVELPTQNLEKAFLISPQKLKGNSTEENEDFEAIEIKKQMMNV